MKKIYLETIFFVLGRAFQFLSRWDKTVGMECSQWPEGFKLAFTVNPSGPSLKMMKVHGKMRFTGTGTLTDENLAIYFKHTNAAFKVFSMQLSFYEAYAYHLAYVKGDVGDAMKVYRIFNQVQYYLLPAFIARLVIKDRPKLTWKTVVVRSGLYTFGILFG